MKLLAAMLVLLSLSIAVHADWDPVAEARYEAEAKKVAEQKAREDKKNRAVVYRGILDEKGIDTSGKSDDEVISMYKAYEKQFTAKVEQMNTDVINDMRKQLGKDADGKSDDEVKKMYEERNARLSQDLQKKAADTYDERDAAMQNMTGKSLEDLENMSDEDMDKMAAELEEKYGQ